METFAYLHIELVYATPSDESRSKTPPPWQIPSAPLTLQLLSGAALSLMLTLGQSAIAQTLLQRGSVGTEVRAVQTRLQELGYFNGPVNGNFFDLTENAVRQFQRAEGLDVDGKVGPATRNRLFGTRTAAFNNIYDPGTENWRSSRFSQFSSQDMAPSSIGGFSANDSFIRQVQTALNQARYSEWGGEDWPEIRVDGRYGPNTRRALEAFQASRNLPITGRIDPATRRALGVSTNVPVARNRSPYVVAVPGDQRTFTRVQACLFRRGQRLTTRQRSDRRGSYVDAGRFSSYEGAERQAQILAACNLDARVDYQ